MIFAWLRSRKRKALLAAEMPPGAVMLTDLDRIISTTYTFGWKGKVHAIKPMSNEAFLRVLRDLSRIYEVKKTGTLGPSAVTKAYGALFMDVCDTITMDDVMEMEPSQATALFATIMDVIKGKAMPDDAQKKSPKAG